MDDVERRELDLLADQLARMRGMLFGYSDLFFRRIRDWGVVTIALLVLGSTPIAPAAVVVVPFLVPFAFLETAYLFFYTIFARRHAEYLERADQRAVRARRPDRAPARSGVLLSARGTQGRGPVVR